MQRRVPPRRGLRAADARRSQAAAAASTSCGSASSSSRSMRRCTCATTSARPSTRRSASIRPTMTIAVFTHLLRDHPPGVPGRARHRQPALPRAGWSGCGGSPAAIDAAQGAGRRRRPAQARRRWSARPAVDLRAAVSARRSSATRCPPPSGWRRPGERCRLALPAVRAAACGSSAPAAVVWLDSLPRDTFRASLMLGATGRDRGFALAVVIADRADDPAPRRLCRLRRGDRDLGLARDELPDGLRRRAATGALPARRARLARVSARATATRDPSRTGDRRDRGRCCSRSPGAQPNQIAPLTFLLLFVHAAVGQVQSLPRRAQSQRRSVARRISPISRAISASAG